MSTRSCIARLTSKKGEAIRFSGVYHHWDGYCEGVGSTLFRLRNGHFKGSTEAMLKMLIDDYPQGWSTINGKDFNLKPEPRPDDAGQICTICNKPNWMHYAQYYKEENPRWVEAGRPECPPKVSGYCVADHSPTPAEHMNPECYSPNEDKSPTTEENASNCGCEYVYAFDPSDPDTMYVLSSYVKGKKMIGMFGCGDPDAEWKTIGKINLNGTEPTEEGWGKRPIKQSKVVKKAKKAKKVKVEEPVVIAEENKDVLDLLS